MLPQIKSKKGISIMVGYVLLVTLAITMGAIIYQNLKTYVPKEPYECPDSTSVFLKKVECALGNFACTGTASPCSTFRGNRAGCINQIGCSFSDVNGICYDYPGAMDCKGMGEIDCITQTGCSWQETAQLNITLKNNGKFSIGGYFIHATNESSQELATIDLSKYFNNESADRGVIAKNAVVFEISAENIMKPGYEKTNVFDIPTTISVDSIEIVPIRFQEEENKIRFVNCGNSKIMEKIICTS